MSDAPATRARDRHFGPDAPSSCRSASTPSLTTRSAGFALGRRLPTNGGSDRASAAPAGGGGAGGRVRGGGDRRECGRVPRCARRERRSAGGVERGDEVSPCAPSSSGLGRAGRPGTCSPARRSGAASVRRDVLAVAHVTIGWAYGAAKTRPRIQERSKAGLIRVEVRQELGPGSSPRGCRTARRPSAGSCRGRRGCDRRSRPAAGSWCARPGPGTDSLGRSCSASRPMVSGRSSSRIRQWAPSARPIRRSRSPAGSPAARRAGQAGRQGRDDRVEALGCRGSVSTANAVAVGLDRPRPRCRTGISPPDAAIARRAVVDALEAAAQVAELGMRSWTRAQNQGIAICSASRRTCRQRAVPDDRVRLVAHPAADPGGGGLALEPVGSGIAFRSARAAPMRSRSASGSGEKRSTEAGASSWWSRPSGASP